MHIALLEYISNIYAVFDCFGGCLFRKNKLGNKCARYIHNYNAFKNCKQACKEKKKVQLKMMGQTFESEILFLTYILCDKSILCAQFFDCVF